MIKEGTEIESRARYPTSREGLKLAGLIPVPSGSKAPLIWIDGVITMDEAEELLPYQRVNKIPCMDYLCFKTTLFKELNKQRKKFKFIDFYSPTYVLPNDYPEFQKMHSTICMRSSTAPTWVIKPKNGCCGRGIKLIHSTYEAEDVRDLSVAQQYINPYLLDGLKFDFRFFVLVSSLDPLTVYIYKEGIARFCTEKYEPPSKANKSHSFCHLTNTAVNIASHKKPEDFTKPATEVLKRFGCNSKSIWEAIKRETALTIAALLPSIMATMPKNGIPLKSEKPPTTATKKKRSKIGVRTGIILQPSTSHASQRHLPKLTVHSPNETEIEAQNQNNKNDVDEVRPESVEDSDPGDLNSPPTPPTEEVISNPEKDICDDDLRLPTPRRFFQILGIDVMIDSEMRPMVLELNDRPSLSVTASFELPLKTDLIREAFLHVTRDGLPPAEDAESGWERLLPAAPGSELAGQAALLASQKSDLRYTGRPADRSPTTARMMEDGIDHRLHDLRRERFEKMRNSNKGPRFHCYMKSIL